MPPVSGCRFWVSVQSINLTPFIQVVMVGGLLIMRARSSFHCPCRQKNGQDWGNTGSGTGELV